MNRSDLKLHLLTPLFLALTAAQPAFAGPTFINALTVAGDASDQSSFASTFDRRLSFGSDLYYDRASNTYSGLADRGPGGGVLNYETRFQQFSLSVNPATGSVSNYTTQSTVLLRNQQGAPLNGLNPGLLNGDKAVVGNSFDPEGIARGRNGNYYIADEYGPSVREFDRTGTQVRVFTTPDNLIARTATQANLVDGRPTIVNGRQDNRGFEGITVSADGSKLIAAMQAPLVNEGAQNDGRRSNNVRLVEFDIASGKSSRQWVYQTESIADINSRIPGTASDFSATQQGRSIGLSAILALPDGRLLVLERDNRGLGVDDLNAQAPVGSKRIYIIDPRNATDVSSVSLANSNSLPAGVVPVTKELYLDIAAALRAAAVPIAEKIEGLEFGPQLPDGSFVMLLVSDNDFSVTQNGSGTQFNVCYDPTGATAGSSTVPLNQACGLGTTLIPSFIYAFKVDDLSPLATVPTPATALLMLSVFGVFRLSKRSRLQS